MTLNDTRPTPTVEDYLSLILRLERDGEAVIAARLADLLNVSAPTVTLTLKRMVRDGWILIDPQKTIRLTSNGDQAAQAVVRRHMLTEWLLTSMLKVPWSEAHDEAHQIEHTISDSVETQMESSLGNPTTCPHGNPLPGFESHARQWLPLIDVQAGSQIIIRRVHETVEEQTDVMRFLETHGLLPGALADVTEVLPFNQTLTLVVKGQSVSVGWPVARYMFVELIPAVE